MPFDDGSEDSLRPGTPLLQGQYLVERFLNAGGFGITYLARDSLDRQVVLKECFPTSMCCRSRDVVRARSRVHQAEFTSIVRLFGQEARRLAKLDHPNIVGVHQVFEDNGTAYMALDFVEGRDLLDVIQQEPGRLGPDQIREILEKMLSAVAYIHAQNVLHRDISPDNILLDIHNAPVLIDFGAARDEARRASRVLSALHVVKDGYSPQEFYLAGTAQSPASDLYSLGATFHHLIVGAAPPHSHMRLAAIAADQRDPYQPLLGTVPGFDGHFLEAIDRALSVFPKDRVQSAESWIETIDTDRRRRALQRQANADERIEQTVAELVRETNAAVRAAQEKAAQEAAEREAEAVQAARLQRERRERARVQALKEAEEAAIEAERAKQARIEAAEAARRAMAEAEAQAEAAHRSAEEGDMEEGAVLEGTQLLHGRPSHRRTSALTPPSNTEGSEQGQEQADLSRSEINDHAPLWRRMWRGRARHSMPKIPRSKETP